MTDNQKALDIVHEIDALCDWGKNKGAMRFYTHIQGKVEQLKEALTAPPVADDEALDNSRLYRSGRQKSNVKTRNAGGLTIISWNIKWFK